MDEMSTTPTIGATPSAQSDALTVLPEIPEYISGKFVHEYIAACDTAIQQRFNDLCARRRVTIPNTEDTLRTEQVELFMDAI